MKYLVVLLLAVLVLPSCDATKTKPGTESTASTLLKVKRCEFKMGEDLFLTPIDSAAMDPEGYYYISSHKSDNVMQVFLFTDSIDANQKVEDQKAALNTPSIFTAKSIEKFEKWGNYTGKGIHMKGNYNGGIIKGKIDVFAAAQGSKGFLIIRQTVTNDDNDIAQFDQLERSFKLY